MKIFLSNVYYLKQPDKSWSPHPALTSTVWTQVLLKSFSWADHFFFPFFFLPPPACAALGSRPWAKASCFFKSRSLPTSSSTFAFCAFSAFSLRTTSPWKSQPQTHSSFSWSEDTVESKKTFNPVLLVHAHEPNFAAGFIRNFTKRTLSAVSCPETGNTKARKSS